MKAFAIVVFSILVPPSQKAKSDIFSSSPIVSESSLMSSEEFPTKTSKQESFKPFDVNKVKSLEVFDFAFFVAAMFVFFVVSIP